MAKYRIVELKNGLFKVQSKGVYSLISWFTHRLDLNSEEEARGLINLKVSDSLREINEKNGNKIKRIIDYSGV